MSRMLAQGPKVFAFDALPCEALKNFDLSMVTADYTRPFPSVVIELPEDYTKKRVVPFEAGSHAPHFLVARHEPGACCVLLAMHLTGHQVLTRLLKLDPAWALEEMSGHQPSETVWPQCEQVCCRSPSRQGLKTAVQLGQKTGGAWGGGAVG